MSFQSLPLQAIYDSAESDIYAELFNPLLAHATSYKRGVGYFTSSWLEMCLDGLLDFAHRDGRITLVTSPHLEQADWDAFRLGSEAQKNEILHHALTRQVNDMSHAMNVQTLTLLAWLVADGILDVKIAIPANLRGDFHDKYAIFEDANGDKVALHGSLNDSQKASFNGEGISVFRSWVPGQEAFVSGHELRFDQLTQEKTAFYRIYDLPRAVREDIVRLRHGAPRPYQTPRSKAVAPMVRLPDDIRLHDFQQAAIEKWWECGGSGLFEMATGTGKTITALAAAAKLLEREANLLVVIAVPFDHLVAQWAQDVRNFGMTPILCHGNAKEWTPKLRSQIQDLNKGMRKVVCAITTYKTGSGLRFLELMDTVTAPALFIADESHYLGSPMYGKMLRDSFQYRIGLSATPDRWFDDEGSARLRSYFGSTVADMDILEAIRGQFLTPYRFYPQPVPLTDDEYERYVALTKKVSLLMNDEGLPADERADQIRRLLIQRSRIVGNAEGKLPTFLRLLEEQIRTAGLANIRHTLVYCTPGGTSEVVRRLANLGIRAREFIHTVPGDQRATILRQFDSGEIQVLVAIKCLDEGVNIPQTKVAYFLSSTTNPREFVQRRGRILRKAPGKSEALLYDFIVVPPADRLGEDGAVSLLKREMPRFAEFADGSINEFEARQTVIPLLRANQLLHLIDLKPWDAYRRNAEERGMQNHE